MFSDCVDSKINKIKPNFDNYLNDKKKESVAQPPVPSIRRPDQLPTNYLPNSQAPNPSNSSSVIGSMQNLPPKPVQLQIKQLLMQGKIFDKELTIKNIQKERAINIFYLEEQNARMRLQVKAIENNLELKINPDKMTVELSFKRGTRYKFAKPESGEPKWMTLTNDLKDEKLVLYCNKDGKTIKSCFQGIVPEECMKVEAEIKTEEKERPEGMEREEGQDTIDDIINFAMPTLQQFSDTEKFRRALKDMKQEQKSMILMDIFKIKKEYQDPTQIDRRKLKCPILACGKVYRQISQLKTHMKKHPELNKHGIELTDYGTFQYNYKALDLALFLGKLYPMEMKKIIKKMKSKQIGE